jgi:hypothetical protein
MKKVRAGRVYTYEPVVLDEIHKVCQAQKGQQVRVVNLPGAPKANTMGQCHVEDAETKDFLGMCSVNSLA